MDETYTAEQLRERARNLRANGHPMGAHECEAHADALEENARLKAAWDASHEQAMKNGAACNEWRDRAERAEAELAKLRQMVAQQAEDDGLWFRAATAPEAYLQQELRRLHAAVEGAK